MFKVRYFKIATTIITLSCLFCMCLVSVAKTVNWDSYYKSILNDSKKTATSENNRTQQLSDKKLHKGLAVLDDLSDKPVVIQKRDTKKNWKH